MAESRDYDRLLFAWQGWRNVSGRELRQTYKRYVELANLAARSNGKCLNMKAAFVRKRPRVKLDAMGSKCEIRNVVQSLLMRNVHFMGN